MPSRACVVMTTYSDRETGKKLIEGLLSAKLAACIQAVEISSHYRWRGTVANQKETLLLIKTKESLFRKVRDFIVENHSYEIPEIIQVPVKAGLDRYLDWIGKECR